MKVEYQPMLTVYERAVPANGMILHEARMVLAETSDTVTYEDMFEPPDGTHVDSERQTHTVSRREWKRWAKLARVFCLLACLLPGCTAPSQPIAEQALTLGQRQYDTIVLDLANIAKQGILDAGAAKLDSSPDNAGDKAVLQDTFNKSERVTWLQIQAERARALLRITHGYVWEQQGVLNIWAREWDEAKARVASEKAP